MRNRYVVQNNGHFEEFTGSVIAQLKNLDLIQFRSTSRTSHSLTYTYTAKPRMSLTKRVTDKTPR